MAALSILLTVLGGLCELGGLALVAVQIRSDRQVAEGHLTAIESAAPPGFYGPNIWPQAAFLDDLEMASGTPAEQARKARAHTEREIRRIQDAGSRAVQEQRTRFQGFIRDLLQGGLGQRKKGAWLLAVGIVLSVAGNIVSAVS